jgi:N-acetylglucosamine kinase-like BadF-type ATPase
LILNKHKNRLIKYGFLVINKIVFLGTNQNKQNMILIADAGSTKTAWVLVNNERMVVGNFVSGGLNPTVFEKDTLSKNIAQNGEMLSHAPYIKQIYMYASGVDNVVAKDKLQKVLSELFDKAEIEIYTDMLAAARATAGYDEGIVSILGTGSNSCYYDGKEVVKSVGYFGYLLMDDASGNWFGKQLLRDYYFNNMPKQIKQLFRNEYKVDGKTVITHLYQKPQPNTYLASFAPFMSAHYKSKYIKDLLFRGFERFISRELSAYKNYKELPLHFNGSIAYQFKNELLAVIEKHGLIAGKIVKNPLEELINYHL